jgi:hypothetical protein
VADAGTTSMAPGRARNQQALADVLRTLAADAAGADPRGLLGEAVTGGLLVAGEVVGCSITQIEADRCRTPAYAGEAAAALDRVQYAAGRGPCLTAIRRGQMRITDDPAALGGSLPGWAEQAGKYGVAGVLSVPLPGAEPAAGINFYAAAPAVFRTPVVTARALLVSRAVTALLARGPGPAQETAPGPDAAASRALLAQARAVVSRAGGLSDTEAFTYLAQRSGRERRSILDVAREVLASPGQVAGRERPR